MNSPIIQARSTDELPGHPDIKRKGEPQVINTEDLIDCYIYDTATSRNELKSTM